MDLSPSATARGGVPSAGEQPAAEEMRAYLADLMAAPSFPASPRRRNLLGYLVEQTLAGRGANLKPYDIARAVLGRDESFDPVNDPIVRIEVGRLRRDLDAHYTGAGSSDSFRIEIGKGQYTVAFARTPSGPPPTADPVAVPVPARSAKWLVRAGLVAVCSAALGLVYWWLRPDTAVQVEGPAVIVEPFETLTGGEEGQLLAAALSRGLVTDLMRFDGIQVFAFEATERPPAHPPVSADMPVYLVRGAVQREPARVRVKAMLTDRPTGRVLWSESYDRSLTAGNLFEVEDDLSAQIVQRLASIYGVISQTTARHLEQARPANLFAYDCVQRAFDYRRTFDATKFPAVRSCLDETIRSEPDYAMAWAMRAFLHLDAARFGRVPGQRVPDELAAGLAAARRSVELAPESPRSLQALAALQFVNGLVGEAEATQRKAIEANPNDPESLAQLGWRLVAYGRYDEGVGLLESAISRSLIVPKWYYVTLAAGLHFEGRPEEAYEAASRGAGPCCGSSYAMLALTAAALGKNEEASEALAEAIRQAPVLGTDPNGFWFRQGISEPVTRGLIAALRKAGLQTTRPDGPAPS